MFDPKQAAVIDFETLPIRRRPNYPPEPVGVAISIPRRKSRYYAWGHINGENNCTFAEARAALGEAYDSGRPLLYHHAKFDVEVAEVKMGMPRLPWDRYHDTVPMLFLADPRAENFQLKSAADRLLGWKQDEKDEMIDWLLENQPIPGIKLSNKPKGKNYAGGYVAHVPPSISAAYAIGDVDRTRALAIKVFDYLKLTGMLEAYDVERELLPHIITMESQGLRIDVDRLGRDVEKYEKVLIQIDQWLIKRLGQTRNDSFNLNSPTQLGEALVKCKAATRKSLGVTAGGQICANKDALANGVKDKQILAMLQYRGKLNTSMGTFMRNWLATAEQSGGYIFTTWNSTRQDRSGGVVGARTGRFSGTPNFMNIPNEFDPIFMGKLRASLGLPKKPIPLPELPKVRGYIVPYEKRDALFDRDYSQQELRILAYYENGALKDGYLKDPWLDAHTHVQQLVNAMLNANYGRKPIKNVNFGLIYGMGVGKLAEAVGCSVEEAKKLKAAVLKTFPGLKAIYTEMKRRAKEGEPIYTYGGREYYCEDPVWMNNHWVDLSYKLPNVLIQGSASDFTKRAIIRFARVKPDHWRILLNIHDQITISAPWGERRKAMKVLKDTMEAESVGEIVMLTEGKYSRENFSKLKDYDKKGKMLLAA